MSKKGTNGLISLTLKGRITIIEKTLRQQKRRSF